MTHPDLVALAQDGFGFWLAGLIDGEGSFQIAANRPTGFCCCMDLVLRADDASVLLAIQARTEIGTIVSRRAHANHDGYNRKPSTHWRVYRKEHCQALVSILDTFPLRTKKARDYAIWREAVETMAAMVGPPRRGHAWDWTAIGDLRERLIAARAYPVAAVTL
jgi:hypothetical protein